MNEKGPLNSALKFFGIQENIQLMALSLLSEKESIKLCKRSLLGALLHHIKHFAGKLQPFTL